MQNLNKENFWNDLKKKYPDAVDHFCKWIDEYKKEVDWNNLFGNNMSQLNPQIKFHDLPIDMQNGIIARYDLECNSGKVGYEKIIGNLQMQVSKLFQDLQNQIYLQK